MNPEENLISVFLAMIAVLFVNALLVILLVFVLLFAGVSLYSPIPILVATATIMVLTQILCLHTFRQKLIRQGKTGVAKGLMMGAVITALINGSCFIAGITNQ